MVICADTSFLFALYGNDNHSLKAGAWLAISSAPISISTFNDFELRNALRFAEFCRRVLPGTATSNLLLFENAIALGRIVLSSIHSSDILAEANQLSAAHTLTGGHRGFDILHVAAAKLIGATHFLTFDVNQKSLATKEGLVAPL